MSDDPMETITSLEAKVFCLHYGIRHIRELEKLTIENIRQREQSCTITSISKIALQLGENNLVIEQSVQTPNANYLKKYPGKLLLV